jgi:hypothetical protein
MQKNLGLELHPKFPGDTIHTGKGNKTLLELHNDINFYMGFRPTASKESEEDEAMARKIERDMRGLDNELESTRSNSVIFEPVCNGQKAFQGLAKTIRVVGMLLHGGNDHDGENSTHEHICYFRKISS